MPSRWRPPGSGSSRSAYGGGPSGRRPAPTSSRTSPSSASLAFWIHRAQAGRHRGRLGIERDEREQGSEPLRAGELAATMVISSMVLLAVDIEKWIKRRLSRG